MQTKPLGNLQTKSKSFADFVSLTKNRRDWILEKAGDKILERLLPDGLPDDLQDMLKDQGKFFVAWLEASLLASSAYASIRTSIAGQRLARLAKKVPPMEQALNAVARNGIYEPLRRMYLVAEANNLNLENSSMRIINKDLTPYQAQSQCSWRGTLAEYRTGSIVTGQADPRGYFSIYFPGEHRNLRGSFMVTRISCNYQ